MLGAKFCEIRNCYRCETTLQGVYVFIYEEVREEPN
jgi:hypothetical protein